MTRNRYPGKKLDEGNNYIETKINYETLKQNPTLYKNIIKPNYQGSLDDDKVSELIKDYLDNPLYMKYKNKIIIGVLNQSWYIIDGQHRIEMAIKLYSQHQIDDYLIFCWYKFNDEKTMRELFRRINIDSTKNQFYINQNEFMQIKINEFINKIEEHHKSYFSKTKSNKSNKLTIEEFRDILIKHEYFKKYNFDNTQDYINFLIDKNYEFYNDNRYEINLKYNHDSFYRDEIKNIEDKIIFNLKRNNFFEWLWSDGNEPPYHKHKKANKDKISPYMKKKVWENEFGNNSTGICPISFCNNLLKKDIKNGWEAGHIISEYNNGDTHPTNLRPICQSCNKSMGSKNWDDYDPICLNIN
tara:strand:- start:3787 stop:4854 length:1068 start_codon:yes stop_codon:yes gene_type:complete